MHVHIQIKLFATLNRFTPEFADSFPVLAGTTIGGLLEQLGIPIEEVNLIFINRHLGNLTSSLEGGETLSLFPPLGGG